MSSLPPVVFSFMPRLNSPEESRRKAIRSRWFGSMFAWILKTKPETSGLSDSITVGAPLTSAFCGRGGGANSASAESNSAMPKWRRAEPKMIGVMWPSR